MTTIVEFHDTGCRVSYWDGARGAYTLKACLHVPFAAAPPAAEDTSPSPATPVPSGNAPAANTSMFAANGAALRQAMREAGLRATEALAIVPKSWVTLRIVTLPSSDPAELTEMARFEAERHIPFNVERHIVAHRVLSVEGIEGARVLLAAMDGPVAEQVTATFAAAGLALTGIDVSTVALANVLRHSGIWSPETDPTVASVHIGSDGLDIVVFYQGQVIFARSASLGGQRFAPDEPAAEGAEPSAAAPRNASAERLAREVRRTLDYAHREFDCPPLARVFVTGFDCEAVQGILSDSLETPVNIVNPFATLTPAAGQESGATEPAVRLRVADAGEGLHEPAPVFAVSVGALLRQCDAGALVLDLVPPAYDLARRSARHRQKTMFAAAAALILLAAVFLGANSVQSSRAAHLEERQAELKRNAATASEVASQRAAVEILAKFTSVEGSALAVLNRISEWKDLFGPSGQRRLSLGEFHYVARKQVTFAGTAASYTDLNDFIEQLKGTGLFLEVGPAENPTMTDAPNNRAVKVLSFRLPCILVGNESASKK